MLPAVLLSSSSLEKGKNVLPHTCHMLLLTSMSPIPSYLTSCLDTIPSQKTMFHEGDLQSGIVRAVQESKSVVCFVTGKHY